MSEALTGGAGRSKDTDAAYERRTRQIIVRVDREVRASQQRASNPDDLPIWLAAMTASLAHASWRQYKAALVAHAETMAESDASCQPVLDRLVGLRWSSADSQPSKRRPLRTSARKVKAAKTEQLQQLQARLTMYNAMAAAFLVATWTTGLRPVEWAGASFDHVGDRVRLRVQNAKSTNGRSHGQHRTLWLDGLGFQQVMAIRQTINAFEEAVARTAVEALQEQISGLSVQPMTHCGPAGRSPSRLTRSGTSSQHA